MTSKSIELEFTLKATVVVLFALYIFGCLAYAINGERNARLHAQPAVTGGDVYVARIHSLSHYRYNLTLPIYPWSEVWTPSFRAATRISDHDAYPVEVWRCVSDSKDSVTTCTTLHKVRVVDVPLAQKTLTWPVSNDFAEGDVIIIPWRVGMFDPILSQIDRRSKAPVTVPMFKTQMRLIERDTRRRGQSY